MKLAALAKSPKGRAGLAVAGIATALVVYTKRRASSTTTTTATTAGGTFTGVDAQTAAQLFGDQGGGISGGPTTGTVESTLADSLVHGYDDLASALSQQGSQLSSNTDTVASLGDKVDSALQQIGSIQTQIATTPVASAAPAPPASTGGGAAPAPNVTYAQSPGVQKYAPKGWKAGAAGFFQANGHWNFINSQGNIEIGVKAPPKNATVFK